MKDEEASDNLRDRHGPRRMSQQSPALPTATPDETLLSPSDRRGEDRLVYTKQRRVWHLRASQGLARILEANRDMAMLVWKRYICVLCRQKSSCTITGRVITIDDS
jgi:hypothetical protein